MVEPIEIQVEVPEAALAVSGLVTHAVNPKAFLVLAHGAGAGMRNRAMHEIATTLADVGISSLRYNFPYMERSERSLKQVGARFAKPELLAAVRAAVQAALSHSSGVPLLAGGKSMGGRMTSLAASERQLPGIRGLVFYGFPLHPEGKLGTERADHLFSVNLPMLFLQGTRDALATPDLLRPICQKLCTVATLYEIEEADHSFKAPGRRTVYPELAEVVADWSKQLDSGQL